MKFKLNETPELATAYKEIAGNNFSQDTYNQYTSFNDIEDETILQQSNNDNLKNRYQRIKAQHDKHTAQKKYQDEKNQKKDSRIIDTIEKFQSAWEAASTEYEYEKQQQSSKKGLFKRGSK